MGQILITLVHGTWGRGFFPCVRPRCGANRWWFQPKSEFRAALKRELGGHRTHFRTHLWSGANSVLDRDRAAKRLADRIKQQARTRPGTKFVIVGHSHGGNVAMKAAARLVADRQPVHVVTLATPFLRVGKRELGWRSHMCPTRRRLAPRRSDWGGRGGARPKRRRVPPHGERAGDSDDRITLGASRQRFLRRPMSGVPRRRQTGNGVSVDPGLERGSSSYRWYASNYTTAKSSASTISSSGRNG